MSIIVSNFPSSRAMRGAFYRHQIANAITSALGKGYRAVVISPVRIIQGEYYSLEFTLRTNISEKNEKLEEPDVLARRLSELRIAEITIEAGAKPKHISELIVQISDRESEKSIRDFNRPSIAISFTDAGLAVTPPPAQEAEFRRVDHLALLKEAKDFPRNNPFQDKSLHEIWQIQKQYQPGKAIENIKELDHLIGWLSFTLKPGERGFSKSWQRLYGARQIETFKEKVLPKLEAIRGKNVVSETFITSRSHHTLTWLSNVKRSRHVPQRVVQELSRVKTMEQAQAYVESAGLKVMPEIKRFGEMVNSVSVHPPENLRSIAPEQNKFKYHAPQIVLPSIECDEVPLGTVLMNYLLPQCKNKPKAEEIFRKYQVFLLAMIDRLDALPFACITGFQSPNPSHDLDHRGFRFFFSSQPDILYKRINSMLKRLHSLFLLDQNAPPTSESKELAIAFQQSLFCTVGDKKVGHEFLEDIKFQSFDTNLIDLR